MAAGFQLRRFAARAGLLFVLLFVVDRGLGALAQYGFMKTRDGDTGGQINGLLEKKAPLLVFGDSRAESHYVPAILSEHLGVAAFNGGFKGSNSLYFYGLEQLVFDHYTPRLIVLDFSAYGIMQTRDDPYDKLDPLYPYWRNDHVWQLIAADGRAQRLRFLSRLYPYNSKIHSIIMFNVMAHRPHASDGYDPQAGVLGDEPLGPLDRRPVTSSDELVSYLERFMVSAHQHGVPIIVVLSPRHAFGTIAIPARLQRRIDEFGYPVLDFNVADYPQFADYRLYRDTAHLNDTGARLFSDLLGAKLCSLYCQHLRGVDTRYVK
jgi:hypothetical protein